MIFQATTAKKVSSSFKAMCWAEVSNTWTSSTRKRKCQKKKNTLNSQNMIIATLPFPQNYDFPRCAHACQKESQCCSYEFSPTYLQCNLNEECKPTQKKYSDFLYCKKIGRLDKVKGNATDLGETESFASLGDLEARAHIIFVKKNILDHVCVHFKDIPYQ